MKRDLAAEEECRRQLRSTKRLVQGWRRVGKLMVAARDTPTTDDDSIEISVRSLEILTEATDLAELLLKRKP